MDREAERAASWVLTRMRWPATKYEFCLTGARIDFWVYYGNTRLKFGARQFNDFNVNRFHELISKKRRVEYDGDWYVSQLKQ